MEVLIKTAIGPGIAGAMEVTAIPDPLGIGNGAAVIMGTINPTNSGAVYPVNCRQTDIHATINYSAANDVTLDLPWVWPYDYLENPYSTSVSD